LRARLAWLGEPRGDVQLREKERKAKRDGGRGGSPKKSRRFHL
jgi:hypothetical protein